MAENKNPYIITLLNDLLRRTTKAPYPQDDRILDDVITKVNSLRVNKNQRHFYDLTKAIAKKGGEKTGIKLDKFDDLLIEPDENVINETVARAGRYSGFESIKEKIPWCKRALKILSAQILSPDDINKTSFIINNQIQVPHLLSLTRNILNTFELEDKAFNLISDTLLYGDMFIEIIDINDTLNKFGLIKESVINKLGPKSRIYRQLKEAREVVSIDYYIREESDMVDGKETKDTFYEIVDDIRESELTKIPDESQKRTIQFRFLNFKKSGISGYLQEEENKLAKAYGDFIFEDEKKEPESDSSDKKKKKEDVDEKLGLENFIIKIHKPHNVAILGDDNHCYGYLIIEKAGTDMSKVGSGSSTIGTTMNNKTKDFVLKVIEQIKKNVDIDFVEENQDLKEIITRILTSVNLDENMKTVDIRYVSPDYMQHLKVESSKNYPFGESLFSSIVFAANTYMVLASCLNVNRFNNSTERRMISYEIGLNRDGSNFSQKLKEKLRRNKYNADQFNNVDTIPKLISNYEDYCVPMKDGKKFIEIADVSPRNDTSRVVEELKMIRDTLVAGLDVPAPHLNIEENVDAKNTLTQENVVFAMTVINYQKMFGKQITSLIRKVLNLIGEDAKSVSINFIPPVILKSEKEISYMSSVTSIIDGLKNNGIPVSLIFQKYIYPFFSKEEIEKAKVMQETDEKISESKNQEMGGMGLGGMDFGSIPPPPPMDMGAGGAMPAGGEVPPVEAGAAPAPEAAPPPQA